MQTLVDYLSTLNSAETQWGIWVNPRNVNDFRIGQTCFENGGVLDNKTYIGTLERLSFGCQDESDAFKEAAALAMDGHLYNEVVLYDAFIDDRLNPELGNAIQDLIDELHNVWALEGATSFVEDLVLDFAA